MEIYKRLAAAQGKFSSAEKDGKNPHFRSSYATMASIMAAVGPALSAEGLAVFQSAKWEPAAADVITIRTVIACGDSGEALESDYASPCPKGNGNPAHAVAAAVTYAKRQAIMLALCLAPSEAEDDDLAGHDAVKKPSKPATDERNGIMTNEMKMKIWAAAKAFFGVDGDKLKSNIDQMAVEVAGKHLSECDTADGQKILSAISAPTAAGDKQ